MTGYFSHHTIFTACLAFFIVSTGFLLLYFYWASHKSKCQKSISHLLFVAEVVFLLNMLGVIIMTLSRLTPE